MKFKRAALAVVLNLAFISTATHADIIFKTQKAGENLCDHVAGQWAGSGLVSAKILGMKVSCEYQGAATVNPASTPYNYDVTVNLHKTSGVCPNNETVVISGFCDPVAGRIVLRSSAADLSGMLSADGRSANLTGKASFPVMGQTVTADVERMLLNKQ